MKISSVFLCLTTMVGLVAVAPHAGMAAPPWARFQLFQRIETDPDSLFPLSEENGPWVIMTMTFSGDEAEAQAKELVHELRSRYKMKAYTHAIEFDYDKPVEGKGLDRFGQPLQMKYRMNERIREIAVLVGDFTSVDDPAAQKTLEEIKYLRPDCLMLDKRQREGKSDYRSLGFFREMQKMAYEKMNLDQKTKGPMRHAFITTNPLISKDYFAPKGVDKLVEQMNAPVKYSLLDCPGRYTVQVATFTGSVVLEQDIIAELDKGKKLPSSLEVAAEKAHKMTEALRAKGYEAYEFHDRYSSIVTIGSFDSVGTERPDGKIEINPQIHEIMKQFGAPLESAGPGMPPKLGKPRTIAGIPFDAQPIPVETPKRNISASYAKPLLGLR